MERREVLKVDKGRETRETFNELLKYIIPGIMGLLFNSIYIVVDGLFVARMLGRNALAAVTVSVPVMEIMIALSMLISVGSGVIISNMYGQDKIDEGRRIFNISSRVLLLVSVFIALGSQVFLGQIVNLLGATTETFGLSKSYLRYLFLFAPGFMFSYGLGTWLRNDGQPKTAMIAQIVGALVNIFLDWFFMGPMQMGVAGASIATGLGPIVGITIMIPHFIKKKGNLYFEKVKMELRSIKEILTKGIPSFSMEFALGLTTLCMNLAISKYMGTIGLAVYGIVGYIALIIYSLFLGMAEGSQPLLSFYHGSNNNKKKTTILKLSIGLSVVIGIVGYILLRISGVHAIKIFAGADDMLVKNTEYAVKFYFIALPITGINIIISSFMQSIGEWRESVAISLMRSLIVLFPVLMVLPRFLSVDSLWLAVPITELLTLLIIFIYYGYKSRKLGINNFN